MTMTIKLAPELEQQVRQRSAAQGRPASALIRDALVSYLASVPADPPSAYELGKDMFGRYEGPTDLASRRKRHLGEIFDAKDQARRRRG